MRSTKPAKEEDNGKLLPRICPAPSQPGALSDTKRRCPKSVGCPDMDRSRFMGIGEPLQDDSRQVVGPDVVTSHAPDVVNHYRTFAGRQLVLAWPQAVS
ncbi:hypothetical protein F442_13083 [Phytophthora nicotianae P10297]|uniref:Uncharacterized protein n=2 Tax=Phytophthora nicotianae TaxID=4792 RepID=W2R4K0_PHYN3|nr:hypothetical protein PPTG_21248 [Phytophthora nicotianae INRA-310]ETN20191.1 hypothetical protein PPTG_21248 [Phytophthora nicotianae INRA-310]ETP39452.1 hypothetical protein F442_13083 [Phytophthora nicotianae P10297]